MKQQYKFLKLFLFNVFLLFLCCPWAIAQSINHKWSKSFGAASGDLANAIATEYPGCIYVTGNFQGTMDVDPGMGVTNLVSPGGSDVFIAKFDTSGNLIWGKSIGTAGNEQAFAIATDTLGHIYITGYFSGTTDLDPGSAIQPAVSKGGNDVFIVHLDSAGNFVWGKSVGGTGADVGNAIVLDSFKNVYVLGNFSNTADFDPGTGIFNLSAYTNASTATDITKTDVFLAKYDTNGNFIWTKAIGGKLKDVGQAIALDGLGNIAITGTFADTVDFDPGASVANLIVTPNSSGALTNSDAFVAKYDTAGNYKWARAIGGKNPDIGQSVTMDKTGNIITTGYFEDTVDFDPGPVVQKIGSKGGSDAFISKYDALGNLVWVKTVGGILNERTYSIKADAIEHLYISGSFASSEIDFDPGANFFMVNRSVTELKNFVLKLDNGGNFHWVRQFGGGVTNVTSSAHTPCFMNLDNLGNVYTTGYFFNQIPADFDPGAPVLNLPNMGGTDCFVQRLSQNSCGAPTYTVMPKVSGCDSLTINGKTVKSSGFYSEIFANSGGCDSIVNHDLVINKSYTKTLVLTVCDSFMLDRKSYTASGIYYDTLITVSGCDSIVTLDLVVNKSSTYVMSAIACDSFIHNGHTFTNSGLYYDTLVNEVGCDSIISLNLTINNSTLATLSVTACDSFTINNITYATSGRYNIVFTSTSGCDSIIDLNLNIISLDVSVTKNAATITANAVGALYQWVDCNNNYTAIPGKTNQSFTATVNGNYAVVITRNGCTDTSDCKSVTHLTDGVEKIGADKTISIYPNPGASVYTLSAHQPLQGATVRISNITGQVVLERKELNGSTFNFDMEGLADGMYIMEIYEGGKRMQVQLVKQ